MFKTALPLLSVTNAKLAYGRLAALRGVSLDLYEGEILGLLGPNGAGKTTLIECLSGRRQLDAGRIDFACQASVSEMIGVVPQEIAIYQDLTVTQNLDVFASLQGIDSHAAADLIGQTLQWARLQDKAKALVRTLSGGMQRRVNIACSVLHEPQILLLDEPTVGVDPQSRESIYEMLDSLMEAGTAILLTTHHLEEAQDRCDRIAIIDNGKLVESGTFDELLTRTVGHAQQLQVQFSARQSDVPAPLRLDADGRSAFCEIDQISTELPSLLKHLEHLPVNDVNLRSPTLQHMFLHLTGKELRE